jgi:hypothetical protein
MADAVEHLPPPLDHTLEAVDHDRRAFTLPSVGQSIAKAA